MRRSIKSILLILAALVYAGTASAVIIDVEGMGPATVAASDMIAVDVTLNSEIPIVSYQFHVGYDPAVVSFVSATPTPPPQFYVYGVNPEAPGAIIVDGTRFFGNALVNQSVMSLVFHVLDGAAGSAETTIAPYLVNYGSIDSVSDSTYTLIPIGDVSLGAGVTVHVVPEPTTTMLMGLGLLGILYAGRRR